MIGSLADLRAASARLALPLTVHAELTRRCNAGCVHCYQEPSSAGAELSRDEWLTTVEQARAAGALVLTLSGGEALLSPHFWPVAERARALGLAVRVFTNGLLLGREVVARLAALHPLSVEVSIFAADPARHDAVVGVPGALSRALRGLFRLKRAGIRTIVKCPLLAGAGEDHAAVRRLAERLGAGVVFDPQIFPRSDGASAPTRCRGEDLLLEDYFSHPATLAHDRPRTEPTPPSAAPCGMARTFVVIAPEGDVLPCPMLRLPAGNVRATPLASLWRESPLLVRLRARRFGALETCGACPRSGYCDRCSAMALVEDGDLDGPSSRACAVAAARERAWGIPAPGGAPAVARARLKVVG